MPVYRQPGELKFTSSDQEAVADFRSGDMSGVGELGHRVMSASCPLST